jgi:transposase
VFIIGIDPHKGSHTAAVLDRSETVIGEFRVSADRRQRDRLLEFAADVTPRSWAIESASGLGALLAQQLVAAGEMVLDVPPTLSARARCSTLAAATRPTRTTPELRRSWRCATPAYAGSPRSITPRCCACWPTGTTTSPGYAPRRSVGCTPCCAASSLAVPAGCCPPSEPARSAHGPPREPCRGRTQAHRSRSARRRPPLRQPARRHQRAHRRRCPGIGHHRQRHPRDRPAGRRHHRGPHRRHRPVPVQRPLRRYTGSAPIAASSGPKQRHRLNPRGNRQLNRALHVAAVTQVRNDTPGRAYYRRKLDQGKSTKEALRALKRQIAKAVYRHLVTDARR